MDDTILSFLYKFEVLNYSSFKNIDQLRLLSLVNDKN